MKFELKTSAKIKKASFNTKDLTIFVGKNSTNKSYIAHIVYMMNKIFSKFNSNLYIRDQFIDKIYFKYLSSEKNKKFIKRIKDLKKTVIIEPYQIEWEHKDLNEKKIQVEKRIVKYDIDDSTFLEILNNIKSFLMLEVINEINYSFNTSVVVLKELILFDFNIEKLILDENIRKIESFDERQEEELFLKVIFSKVSHELFKQKVCSEQFYFPASRTGFVLAFDEIVSGVLRDRFGGQPTATKLTEPTIDFISGFSDIKSGKFGDEIILRYKLISKKSDTKELFKKKKKNLLSFIEQRIIKGKIVEEQKQQNYTQFYLQPKGSKKIELHLTSSATVELLPLVIFLKHFSKIEDRLLVIEEPEAHLHPSAQIEMARLLVMLVNLGARVLVTTHSDYILNEINNCIKLSEINERQSSGFLKDKGLTKDIIIEKSKVSAYLFKDNENITEVKNLEIDRFGIANDNFDDVLDELLERSEEINELMEI